MSFINRSFASVGFDANGDGLVEQAIRLDWDAPNIFGEPTSSGGPQANAMLPAPVSVGQPVKLEGRFSHSADGNFVHFNWTVALAPPGGTAELTDAQTATPTLTADLAGDYLVKLEVSNRTGSSSDAIVVHAGPIDNSTATYDDPSTGMNAGADRSASLYDTVTLDGRASLFDNNRGSNYPHTWTLYTPPGSQAVLNDASVMQPTFTPDVPGIYYALISHYSYDNYETHTARVAIGVGTDLHFDFRTTMADNVDRFTVTDFDNDGDPDILVSTLGGETKLLRNNGGGRFAAPVSLDVNAYTTIADLNGDGRADMVGAVYSGGFTYRLRQDDGSFGPQVTVNTDWTWFCSSAPIVARLAGAARNSVLLTGCIDAVNHEAIAIFPPQPGGVLGAPRLVSTGEPPPGSLIAADVNGDGIADLVFAANPEFGNKTVWVMPGAMDGSFGAAVAYPVAVPVTRISAVDVNGDGLLDVVLDGYEHSAVVQVMYQQVDGTLGSGMTITGLLGSAVAQDINGDGLMDVVGIGGIDDPASFDDRTEFGLFLQQADGSFADELLYPAYALSIAALPGNVRVADINADGVADLLYLANGSLQIMLGDPLDSDSPAVGVRSVRTENRDARQRTALVGAKFRRAAVWGGAVRSGGSH